MRLSRGEKDTGIEPVGNSNSVDTIFSPIKTKRAFDEISHEIKRLIFKGILKPGDRLPSETELAARFSVGRQTIREALRLLELSGFIGMQKGGAGGPLVVDTILNSITNSFLDAFQMGKISIDEHTNARLEIEKMVFNYALNNIEQTDVKCLQENIDLARRNIEKGLQAFEINLHFHKLLARATRNHIFIVVMESITASVAHIRSLLGMDLELSGRVVEEHQAIVSAIVAGNKAEALDLLEQHLTSLGHRYAEFVGRLEREGKDIDDGRSELPFIAR
jgi:GntR family transcriptional regulator, transcriptional repressor for pyruvate dehydrogenase complex